MSIENAAQALISGEYSNRRYHLDGIIDTWDGLAIGESRNPRSGFPFYTIFLRECQRV